MDFKNYYKLAKPGIVYGNSIAAIAGFFLASKGHIHIMLFFAMLSGISFVIASACVFNNYIDRGIDARMERTKKRALVKGLISSQNAILYGILLGLLGFFLLAFYVNFLTVFLGIIGYFFYIVLYGIWKRKSVYGTLVGSISGAIPPVAGYCAVTNHFDVGALLLFFILVAWQMPHFYSLAMYRVEDYAAASLPVLPVKTNAYITKKHIVVYIIAFIIIAMLFTFFHITGYIYLLCMLLITSFWLKKAFQGFHTNNNTLWGKSMFRLSLIVLLTFCLMISLQGLFFKNLNF